MIFKKLFLFIWIPLPNFLKTEFFPMVFMSSSYIRYIGLMMPARCFKYLAFENFMGFPLKTQLKKELTTKQKQNAYKHLNILFFLNFVSWLGRSSPSQDHIHAPRYWLFGQNNFLWTSVLCVVACLAAIPGLYRSEPSGFPTL